MALGSETVVVNGQRIAAPTQQIYNPTLYGVQTTGVPQVSPTMPPYLAGGSVGSGPTASGVVEGVGGYGTAANNTQATAIAAANPLSIKASPVPWAIFALVFSIVMLNIINWRRTTLESFDEKGNVGPVRESASESA